MENGSKASIITLHVVYTPQKKGDGGNVTLRSNKSYHFSKESAVLGQTVIMEKTEIDERIGIQFEGGGVFLVEGTNRDGLLMADADALKKEIRTKAMERLSDAEKIALGLPLKEE